LAWWDAMPIEARRSIIGGGRIQLDDALDRLVTFLSLAHTTSGTPSIVWANPPSFDCTILSNAYADRAGAHWTPATPWGRRAERDLLTISEACVLAGFPVNDLIETYLKGRPDGHNALADATAQARFICACVARLRSPLDSRP